jgi:hypothetical protein
VTPTLRLLFDVYAAGLLLRLDDNDCLCVRPADRLTLDMRRSLSRSKPELIAMLRDSHATASAVWNASVFAVAERWDRLFASPAGAGWIDDSDLRQEAREAIADGDIWGALDAAARWRCAWLRGIEAGSLLPKQRRRNVAEER